VEPVPGVTDEDLLVLEVRELEVRGGLVNLAARQTKKKIFFFVWFLFVT
jgi:hypothetical protein